MSIIALIYNSAHKYNLKYVTDSCTTSKVYATLKKSMKSTKAFITGAAVLGVSAVAANLILANTAYTVTRVIDGDTFETKERQIVRLKNIDAPEIGLCGGETSKKQLESLILGKKVYIKTDWLDRFRRNISIVYLSDGTQVNEEMLKLGGAIADQKGASDKKLLKAGEYARTHKLGVFGPTCTQESNTENPSCVIKGNRAGGENVLVYHYPGCPLYDTVQVQLYLGDQWFCTEKEAEKAGYKKADRCP